VSGLMFPHLFFSITQYPYFWVSGKIGAVQNLGEKIVKEIKRATRKQYSSEEEVRIVLDGLRGEDSIAEVCRREGISQDIASMEMDKLLTEDFPKSEAIDVFKIMSTPQIWDVMLKMLFGNQHSPAASDDWMAESEIFTRWFACWVHRPLQRIGWSPVVMALERVRFSM